MITLTQRTKIKQWLKEVVEKRTWPDHDLHIDRISFKIKKNPSVWIKNSLEFFQYAKKMKDRDFCLALVIPLKSTATPREVGVIDVTKLQAGELSHTPPSLYLYDKRHPTYIKLQSESVEYPFLGFETKWLYRFYQHQDPNDGTFFSSINLIEK